MIPGNTCSAAGALWLEVARRLHHHATTAETQFEVVQLACTVIRAGDHAGLTVLDHDKTMQSATFTDPLVRELDQLQTTLGEGPCLEAMTDPRVLLIEDMENEYRWPQFTPQARRLGIAGMLACKLATDHGPPTALNLYARQPGAFDNNTVQTAIIYAEYAGTALSRAALVESLQSAVATRQVIGEATGILMERRRLDSPPAFALLVTASQRLNAKVRHIAEHTVRTGQDPETLMPADLPDRPVDPGQGPRPQGNK